MPFLPANEMHTGILRNLAIITTQCRHQSPRILLTALDMSQGCSMARKQLKIVRLLEPELCLECRFAQTADVENESGVHQRMIYCRRLDCDNWDIVNAEPAKSMEIDSYGLDEAA